MNNTVEKLKSAFRGMSGATLRQRWLELPSKTRLIVLVVVGGLAMFPVVNMFSTGEQQKSQVRFAPAKERLAPVWVSTDGAKKLEGELTETHLAAMQAQITERERQVDAKAKEMVALEKRMRTDLDTTRLESAELKRQLLDLQKDLTAISKAQAESASQPASGASRAPAGQSRQASARQSPQELGDVGVAPKAAQKRKFRAKTDPALEAQPAMASRAFVRGGVEYAASPGALGAGQLSEQEQKKSRDKIAKGDNDKKTKDDDDQGQLLPAGSIVSGIMITGQAVPTSGSSRRNPAPVAMKITKEALLPNGFTMDLQGCIIIGSAIGNASTHRVDIRAEAISCVDEEGRAIENNLMASAQGPDGLGGIPAKLVTLHGEAVKKSMLAGVAGSLADTFQGVKVNEAGPDYVGNGNADIGALMGSAAANGAGSAMERIADFYLNLADEAKPYLEMQGGVYTDFIVQRGATLKYKGKR